MLKQAEKDASLGRSVWVEYSQGMDHLYPDPFHFAQFFWHWKKALLTYKIVWPCHRRFVALIHQLLAETFFQKSFLSGQLQQQVPTLSILASFVACCTHGCFCSPVYAYMTESKTNKGNDASERRSTGMLQWSGPASCDVNYPALDCGESKDEATGASNRGYLSSVEVEIKLRQDIQNTPI